jgi:hypothetical protein
VATILTVCDEHNINTIQQPMISGQHCWLPHYGNMGLTDGSIVINFYMVKLWRTGFAKRLLRLTAWYNVFTLGTETGCGQLTSISLICLFHIAWRRPSIKNVSWTESVESAYKAWATVQEAHVGNTPRPLAPLWERPTGPPCGCPSPQLGVDSRFLRVLLSTGAIIDLALMYFKFFVSLSAWA